METGSRSIGKGLDHIDFVHTGPATLAGRYLRMFWQPVCCSHELAPGRALPIRILGEDFTLYRGQSGTPYLVGHRCAHRGAQLSAGWVEEDSIRCFYHGWKYDGSGQCVEQPAEPEPFARKIRIPAYPVREHIGLIFAYLGEGEPPHFTRYPKFESPEVSLDVTLYYSDIRNLLGMEIKETYEGFLYGRYINRDYGNVKGLILTLDKRFADFFSAKIDYTYQIAAGNASDPMTVYYNNVADPPIEVTKKNVPLNWDQTHTLNLSITVGDLTDWTAGIVFGYGSGMPYSEDKRYSQGVRFENGGRKPSTVNVDLKANKHFNVFGLDVNTFLLVYNLFDTLNEYGVYSSSGRAGNDLNTEFASPVIGLNTIEEYVKNPTLYSTPRRISVGVNVGF